ncbi:hypothetical protein [Falsirhodobacter sp. 20TX0035]|uniref:hypothetical protein n=1 Tax=Falsirhodobacter sp. 20TX0035 TaxID=3022019 RepID=UPI00232EF865|nr:hypothetical protein [Falsirhodobacter sp. 20TX0035]MDB6454680.1 hypothetical protein [Falsirhodobacter sp. 20TX0035]
MAFSSIPPLPVPPTLADPASFNNRAEAFVGAMPATMAGINNFAVELNQLQLGDMSSYVYTFFKATNAQQARASLGMDYATQAEAEAGAATTKVLSPLRGAQQFAKLIAAWFTTRLASSTQAAAADANDVLMTPLRTQDWFGGQRPTPAEAAAGTLTTKIMTPAATRQAVNAEGMAPIYAVRAWGDFTAEADGAITINGSGNVASIVTDGGGYRITLAKAMPSANYAVAVSGQRTDNAFSLVALQDGKGKTATEFTLTLRTSANNFASGRVMFMVVG